MQFIDGILALSRMVEADKHGLTGGAWESFVWNGYIELGDKTLYSVHH